jgi:hypothetical protein
LEKILDRIWLFFSSVKLTIVLLLLFGIAMGYGTWIETVYSNGAARILIYQNLVVRRDDDYARAEFDRMHLAARAVL